MGRRWLGALVLAAAFCTLSGCTFNSPEDLYAVPRAAEDYKNLQDQIDKVRGSGAEYAGPMSGSYTQPVQLMDLDGDGVQEAVAFFRMTSADSASPLKIYIYHQNAEGEYEVQNVVEGDAPAINSVAYVDLDGELAPNGNPDKELVVSWRLSDKVYQLGAYSVSGTEAVELMAPVSYTNLSLIDLDKDNQQEIVLLRLFKNENNERVGQADYYDYQDGQMVLAGSAPMSKGIEDLAGDSSPQANYVRNGELSQPALYVTSTVSSGVITDIFALRDGALTNITLVPGRQDGEPAGDAQAPGHGEGEGGVSDTFSYSGSGSAAFRVRDINNDGYLEVPQPNALPNVTGVNSPDFWCVRWMQYDLAGQATETANTYFNGEDGWYLVLPESWQGRIALARQDNTNGGERGVFFYPYTPNENGGAGVVGGKPFLAIYKLTGSNQATRAHIGARFALLEQDGVVYAAEIFDSSGWDSGLTQEGLLELFHLI